VFFHLVERSFTVKTAFPLLIVCFLFLLSACAHHDVTMCKCATGAAESGGVFIHVTSGPDDPHRVLMALQMAALMAETQDVALYFDIQGVYVLLKDSEDLRYSHFPSSHEQIKKLVQMKVPVMACPGCMKSAGKTAEDLMPGVMTANKETFFNFTKGRILTLDY
jgi:predicted peroxiredoxin